MWAHHSDSDQGRAGVRWRAASRGIADRQAETRRTLVRPSVLSVLQYIFRRPGRDRVLVLRLEVVQTCDLDRQRRSWRTQQINSFFGIEGGQFQIADVRAGNVIVLLIPPESGEPYEPFSLTPTQMADPEIPLAASP